MDSLSLTPPCDGCSTCNLREVCLPCGLQAGHPLFDDLVYARKRLKRGETLYRTGGACENLYAVRSGFFKSCVTLEDGRNQVIGFHMAGEFVGTDGLATDTHAADVIALEDGEVCVIPCARLEGAGMQRQLHKIMSRELVQDRSVMTLLGMNAEERLAAFLLNLSQRLSVRGYSGSEFHLRMTREDIGSHLGLSLETVSRLFSRFQDEALITVQQRHVCILDMAGLKGVLDRQAPNRHERALHAARVLARSRSATHRHPALAPGHALALGAFTALPKR